MVWRKLSEEKKRKKLAKKKKLTNHRSIININLYLNVSDTQLIFMSYLQLKLSRKDSK